MCKGNLGVGVGGSVGKGVGNCSHDKYIGKSGLHVGVGGLGLYGVAGLGVGGSGVEIQESEVWSRRKSEVMLQRAMLAEWLVDSRALGRNVTIDHR